MTNTPRKDKNGNIEWRNEKGQLHRENGPAIELADGPKQWYRNGQVYRENGPAIEWASGTKEWYQDGHLHRENGPAIECADGSKGWYLNGDIHRENGPAIEYASGDIEYYINNQTGPEIEQQVKENMARIQQQKLLDRLSQDQDISAKINIYSSKISKKL